MVRRDRAGAVVIGVGECDLERRDRDREVSTGTIRVGEGDLDLVRRDRDGASTTIICAGERDREWCDRESSIRETGKEGRGRDRDRDREENRERE